MKLRIILTGTLISGYFFLTAITSAIQSPVSGATTAAQLDDTTSSFVLAHFVREDFIGKTVLAACAVSGLLIWTIPTKKKTE